MVTVACILFAFSLVLMLIAVTVYIEASWEHSAAQMALRKSREAVAEAHAHYSMANDVLLEASKILDKATKLKEEAMKDDR